MSIFEKKYRIKALILLPILSGFISFLILGNVHRDWESRTLANSIEVENSRLSINDQIVAVLNSSVISNKLNHDIPGIKKIHAVSVSKGFFSLFVTASSEDAAERGQKYLLQLANRLVHVSREWGNSSEEIEVSLIDKEVERLNSKLRDVTNINPFYKFSVIEKISDLEIKKINTLKSLEFYKHDMLVKVIESELILKPLDLRLELLRIFFYATLMLLILLFVFFTQDFLSRAK